MLEIGKGSTVYIDLPSPDSKHLFFVLTQPFGEPPVVIMVNISTVRGLRFEDHTTILDCGDHPYITHRSFVAFDYARKIRVDVIEQKINEGSTQLMDDLSDDIVQRILEGFLRSSRTPSDLKSICRKLEKS